MAKQSYRKAVRESVVNMLNELEVGMIPDEAPTPTDVEVSGVGDPDTGLKVCAAQAISSLGELIKQCGLAGVSSGSYEDMVSSIQDAFGLTDLTQTDAE